MNEQHSVLIVEDDETLRQALADKFSAEGFKVWQAPDGVKGFALVEERLPSAIILDLVIQEGPGVEMLRRIRLEMPDYAAPIIVLTNSNDQETIADVMQFNVTTYLIKSDHSLSDIVKSVTTILESVN